MKSIKYKIFVYFMIFTAFIILINFAITNNTLKKYLIYSNINTVDNFLSQENLYNENILTTDKLDVFSQKYNSVIYVLENNKTIYSSSNTMGNSQGFIHSLSFSEKTNYEIRQLSKFSFDFLIISKSVNQHDFVVQFPLNYIDAQIETLRNLLNLMAIFILTIGIAFSFFISNIISKPIISVEKTAKEISQLNFSNYLPESRKDEFGSLNKSINTMGNNLKSAINNLESANIQLKKDVELLNSNEQLRKQLFSDFSHELKTPVALIQGYSELIIKKEMLSDPKLEKYMNTIIFECDRLNYLTKEILSLSDLESHQVKLNYSTVNLSNLLHDILDSFEESLKDFKVSIDIQEDISISCDKNRTSTLLNNLITNSIDHNNGDKIISINLKALDDKIKLSVYNTTDPIPEEELKKLWLNFYKLDKSRNRKFGGSGLGLSIVSKIISLHGWDKEISNVDKGIMISVNVKS